MRSATNLLDVPESRRQALERLAAELRPGLQVAVSTHMNADGDGCGSEAALARILAQRGMTVRIVNPTPWPAMFDFLLDDDVHECSTRGAAALAGIDLLAVVDISDVKRLGHLTDAVRALTVPKLVIDHHIATDEPAGSIVVADTSACATGELIFDLGTVLDAELTEPVARALYAALLTDTGGFRFSNTSPRCHAMAGRLLGAGVNPEEMYRRIYASVPVGRMHLLRDALATLEVDSDIGLGWLSVPADALERYKLKGEELDGIVEYARSIAGTRLALFFRDLGHGRVKISFRSTGDVDANCFARQFGGGGHARASGALVAGSLDEVRDRVVLAAREFLAKS